MDREIGSRDSRSGASIDVTDQGQGVYLVQQLVPPNAPTQPINGTVAISYSFGPLTVTGTVNTSTLGVNVRISILGIDLGSFNGDLKDGLRVKVDLVAAKGEVRVYLKNGNEVWLGVALSVVFDGKYDTDVKVVSI